MLLDGNRTTWIASSLFRLLVVLASDFEQCQRNKTLSGKHLESMYSIPHHTAKRGRCMLEHTSTYDVNLVGQF